VPLVLRVDGRERRILLKSPGETVDTGGKIGWMLGNAGARGFYRTAYDPELLRRLVSALAELRPEERMALVSDQWALVRANAVKTDSFLQLLAGMKSEEDHTVLDEVVARLAWLEHRGVAGADRPALRAWIRSLFAGVGADLGWDPAKGEDDERRLRRAAVLRALALVQRAVDLGLDPFVQMQDFASYVGTLLGNREAREAAWRLVQSRWEEVRRKGDSPMILRRLIEALGSLPERRHLEEVERFLAAQELSPARQAVAQTLERLRADVALRERLLPELSASIAGRS